MAEAPNTFSYIMKKPTVIAFTDTLFAARAVGPKGRESGDPKYGCTWIFAPESEDLKELKALAVKAARAKWPSRDLKELKFPFSDGTKDAEKYKAKSGKDSPFQIGKVLMKSKSKYSPRLSGIENGVVTEYGPNQMALAKQFFYPGVEAAGQFTLVAYDGIGNNPDGVTCYVNMVHTTKKGDRIAGGRPAAEVFKDYVGHATDEDPTGSAAGMDDEIPF